MSSAVTDQADKVREYARFEKLLVDLSARFVSLRPEEVESEIVSAQQQICESLHLDRSALWEFPEPGDRLRLKYLYEPDRRYLPIVDADAEWFFPWVVTRIRQGQSVVLERLDDLPPEAARDKETFQKYGTTSTLIVPLIVGGRTMGALSFALLGEERRWSNEVVSRFQLVATVVAHALARKRSDEALRASEEINRATFELAAVGIAHVAPDGRWLRVNDKLCAVIGYPREELLQLTFQDITHPDDLESDREDVRQILAGEITTRSKEKRCIRKDRSVVWVNVTVSLARTATGEPRHFIAVVEDITHRVHAEEALRLSDARLTTGVDLAGIAFYEADFANRAFWADDRFCDLFGLPPDRVQGLQPLEFWMAHLHPEDRQRVMDMRQQLHGGSADRVLIEYRFLHPTRGETWIHHASRVTLRDANGHMAKAMGALRDITTRKQAEEALQHSYAEVERLKDRLQAESDYLKAEIGVTNADGITGSSPAIKAILRQVGQVAPTVAAVLISGETGTGKELLARATHRLSPRRSRLMLTVNCAAMPSGLVESELFGREKGAFTGALTRQVGRFEIADGSTIFLDEVGELSLEVQAKLLRVLQEGEFERLGSPRTIKVDVRVIAATNRDLAEAVRKGRFREDLYYRLKVFPLRMPALRERTEDIPLLVWEFLQDFSARMGKKITQVSRTTMDALQRHPWPGNVRELRNVIEHGAIITTGHTLRVPMLGDAAPGEMQAKTMAEVEREHILRTLERSHGRIKGPKGAAAILGINSSTLRSRMKKLDIKP